MKKYIILLLATTFLLGTSVSSCTNFLEEKPESEFDEGTFYKTVESLKVGAVGAFSTLRYMYNVGTNTPLFVGMVGTDECMYPNETNLRGFIDRYTYTPTDGCIKQFWFRYYRLITACNTVIYKAQGIEGDAKLINRYVANVRFLRAWGYFNLVQTFGAVPLMTGHVTELTYDMGRTPVAEVYQLIEDDLLFCLGEDVLPKEIDGGWANYWAAKTLLAKVYITMASAYISSTSAKRSTRILFGQLEYTKLVCSSFQVAPQRYLVTPLFVTDFALSPGCGLPLSSVMGFCAIGLLLVLSKSIT